MPRAQSRGPQTLPMAGRQKGQPPLGANAETYKQHVHPGSDGVGWGWQLGSAVRGWDGEVDVGGHALGQRTEYRSYGEANKRGPGCAEMDDPHV